MVVGIVVPMIGVMGQVTLTVFAGTISSFASRRSCSVVFRKAVVCGRGMIGVQARDGAGRVISGARPGMP
jgi:hypothetical protein